MEKKRFLLLAATLLSLLPVAAQDVWTSRRHLQAVPFDMKEVRLKDGVFKHTFDLNHRYLRNFSAARLLYNFRANAGMPNAVPPLGGWESPDCELRGHFTGHFLSALALGYSSTGDETLRQKADSLVSGLADVQRKLGKSGYLSAFPETFFDRLEKGENVWAPYYTIHKVLAGLLDAYMYLDNQQALDVAKRLGTWVYDRNRRFSHDEMQQILRTEFGGIGESLWVLYDLTRDTRYREAAGFFKDDRVLDPLYRHEDRLQGLHSNTQLPKLLAQARAYETDGDPRDRDMVAWTFDEIVRARTYVTGGNSNYEYFRSRPYELANVTGPNDHENCVTHNMLKLASHLFMWDPQAAYADYYERALLNGILGTQHPEVAGTAQYYVAQRPGAYREYCDPDWSYVCCSGTGIESYAKLNNNIYYHSDSVLWVNQYIASTLTWKERALTLDMETGWPRFDDIHLTVGATSDQLLELRLRVPAWAEQGVTVAINGERQAVSASAGSYLAIRRVWRDGDKVDLVIPRTFHLWHMPDNPNRVAILYGPVVMAAGLGTTDMGEAERRGFGGDIGYDKVNNHVVDVPAIVADSDGWLQAFRLRKPHRLTFDATGIAQLNDGTGARPVDVTLSPFYDMRGQRYTLYFDVYTPAAWKAFNDRFRTFGDGVYDRIDLANDTSMYDHNFQSYYLERGETEGRAYVQSRSDLRFDLRIPQDKPFRLRVTYYGDESGTRFGLKADGHRLEAGAPAAHDGFFTVLYDLPREVVAGKKRVCIGFDVPRDRGGVSVGETTTRKEYRYVTPRVYGAEIVTSF